MKKYIKVITETRKEDFENEIAKYMNDGFKIEFSNISVSSKPILKDAKTGISALSEVLNDNNYKINNCIVFYALMIKKE